MSARPPESTLPESWRVRLPIFEGPLDLLLHLVRVDEVEITDIPVARICDQFHEYLGLMEDLNLDIAAEYIYEAAQLIFLKSRMLLPRHPRPEGAPDEDPRRELVARLLEYRRIKQAAQSLAAVERLRQGVWPRRATTELAAGDDTIELGDVSLYDLLKALKDVFVRFDREHPDPLLLRGESFRVRDQLHRLLRVLDAARPFDLLHDLRGLSCRAEAVAAFLAVLELARLQLVRLHQTEAGELLLYRTTRELRVEELEAIQG